MALHILVLGVAIPAIVGALLFLLYQRRGYQQLQSELKELTRLKRHTVEYDLVLKAMKLSIWHLDLTTMAVTFESDYRDMVDSVAIPARTSMTDVLGMFAPQYAEAIGKDLQDFADGKIDECHEQYQMRIPHSDRTYWGELFATVEKRDLKGRPLSVVGTSMRIDKQKSIEQALIAALNKAEESDRLKTAFLANISHEVRTPLNAIVGFSDVLPLAHSEEERNELIALIRQNNAHLLRLFDDMVSMSKLEAGGGLLQKERFPLGQLLDEVVGKYLSAAAEKGLTLQVEGGDTAPVIYTDRSRVREILNQYVNNALKFTSQGGVTVGCDASADKVRLWVRDTGKGIAEEFCGDRLFERFVKVDDFIEGTGLGLSICRSMALSLGGTVGVSSKLGEGSLFWVELNDVL